MTADRLVAALRRGLGPGPACSPSPGSTPAGVNCPGRDRRRRGRPQPRPRPGDRVLVVRRRPPRGRARRRGRLGCDFLVAGCRKWLFGPRGTGLVWGRRDAWPRPALHPRLQRRRHRRLDRGAGAGPAPPCSSRAASAYEHRWALAEAFRFHLDLGEARVADRTPRPGHPPQGRPGRDPRRRLVTPATRNCRPGSSASSPAPRPARSRPSCAARASWPASPLRPALSAPRPQHRHLRGRRGGVAAVRALA